MGGFSFPWATGAGEAQTPMLVGANTVDGQICLSDCSIEMHEVPRVSVIQDEVATMVRVSGGNGCAICR